MTIKFNDSITPQDNRLVLDIVDERGERNKDLIRVNKTQKDEGYILVLKNGSRGKKLNICNDRHTREVKILFIDTPILAPATLGIYQKVVRELDLKSSWFVNRVVPEMRDFLYSGEPVRNRVKMVQAVKTRAELTNDNVVVVPIKRVLKQLPVADGEEYPRVDLVLANGEIVMNVTSSVKALSERLHEQNQSFLYAENAQGAARVLTQPFFDHNFAF